VRKQEKKGHALYIFICLALFSLSLMQISAEEIERSQVVGRVICSRDSSQTYALFLPSTYTPDKKWPILYAFDPMARGIIPVKLFREAAERYGYILVGSNNSRNGPWENCFKAAQAVWKDTHLRFSIDNSRVYTTGYSGGARVASGFSSIVKIWIAGVIACSGGLPAWLKTDQMDFSLFFGTAGIRDFNYREIKSLDKKFDSLHITHRIRIFDGGHEWPPTELCKEAVEWMELQAMKSGNQPKDSAFIEFFFSKNFLRAKYLQSIGYIYDAALAYEAMASDFKGIRDVSQVEKEASFLREAPGFREYLEKEEKIQKEEKRLSEELEKAWQQLPSVLFDSHERYRVIRMFNLKNLARKAQKKDDVMESAMAHRLLGLLALDAYSEGMTCYGKGLLIEAEIYLEIASEASLKRPDMLYNLACVYSLKGEKKKALKTLKRAVKNGFKDVETIINDTDLAPLRETEEFKALLEILKRTV
jgi:tetratricopeptide (TPR) repeat protein